MQTSVIYLMVYACNIIYIVEIDFRFVSNGSVSLISLASALNQQVEFVFSTPMNVLPSSFVLENVTISQFNMSEDRTSFVVSVFAR